MIGFRPQSTSRRPIYSDMGTKLFYVESTAKGEYWTDLNGRRIGRITRWKKTRAKEINTTVAGSDVVTGEESWEY